MKQQKSKKENRRKLIKQCIKILKSKEVLGIKLRRYCEFIDSSPLLSDELSNHLYEIGKVPLKDFSIKDEILFLKSKI